MSSLTAGRFGPGIDPGGTGLAVAGSLMLSALSFPARGKACGETTSRREWTSGNGGRTYWRKKHGAVHSMGAKRLGGLSSWNSTRQGRVSVSAESL